MKYWFVVAVILFFSFFLRIKNINRPLLDAHYFRQTQTATVTRNFYLKGVDFFHTELDIFGNGKEKTLLLEFPFYQATVTLFSYLLGFHDYVGRLVSLSFTFLSGIIIILIANKLFPDKFIGLAALVFFIFNPLNYYFHQAYMIESTVIFLHLFSIYLWIKYTESKDYFLVISATIITSLAYIHKNIYAPFLLIIILGILYFRLKKAEFKLLHWLPATLISLFILFAWQYYVNITNFQNGHSNFTLSSASQQLWNFGTIGERFDRENWLQKLNFIQNSVTKFQWPMFLVGIILLVTKKLKTKLILLIWLGATVLYYLVFFRIQSHDYYFMFATLIFSIISAYGLVAIVKLANKKFMNKKYNLNISILILFLYLFLFSYKSIQNSKLYFHIDYDMQFRLKSYNSVLKNGGNVLFVLPEYDWNSVYTYYTGHKAKVITAKDISDDIISQYAKIGYDYVIIDGIDAVKTVEMKNLISNDRYNKLLSGNELLILDISP